MYRYDPEKERGYQPNLNNFVRKLSLHKIRDKEL